MRTLILTGGSSGIGLSILKRLLSSRDWNIVVLSRRPPPIEGGFLFYECDLASSENVIRAIEYIKANEFQCHALVNCAGHGRFGPIESLSLDDWHSTIALNLTAPFLLVRGLLPLIRNSNAGFIINIGSDADHTGFSGATAYCASKFALRGLGDALRVEVKGSGIKVTTISPARVDTNFNGKYPGDRPNSLSPDDVAELVVACLKLSDRAEIETIRMKSTLE